jgi:23S rRNA maturation mini-RNase III
MTVFENLVRRQRYKKKKKKKLNNNKKKNVSKKYITNFIRDIYLFIRQHVNAIVFIILNNLTQG